MSTRPIMLLAAVMLAASAQADPLASQGREVFIEQAQPSCTLCHTLANAGASGTIGPDLDKLVPSEQQVKAAVSSGVGVMPAYGDSLTSEQITAVARYVSSVSGK
ncbi:c-type cytochrome [Marinobacter sp. M1N3S26]|uniref:SorU family sulfite dehydrogenase c-type cytochrome subunit n=1 Tax=unclassified Marinobacter TaxID=83889 RepID=UPI00387AA4C3